MLLYSPFVDCPISLLPAVNSLFLPSTRTCYTCYLLRDLTRTWQDMSCTRIRAGQLDWLSSVFLAGNIPGENNIWADMFTRWAAPDYDTCLSRRISALKVPLITDDMPELPSMHAITESQKKYPLLNENGLVQLKLKLEFSDLNVWTNNNGKITIPIKDEELQLRVIVDAHCGFGGHRGYTTTCGIIKDKLT